MSVEDVCAVDLRVAAARWPALLAAVAAADTLALDLEFSGLSDPLSLSPPLALPLALPARYAQLKRVAGAHALLALGVCAVEGGTARVFSVPLLCAAPHVADPAALRFLARHGLDFNEQARRAARFY